MNKNLQRQIEDYFTPAELIEMLDVSTSDLIEALLDYDEDVFNDDVIDDIREIMNLEEDDD